MTSLLGLDAYFRCTFRCDLTSLLGLDLDINMTGSLLDLDTHLTLCPHLKRNNIIIGKSTKQLENQLNQELHVVYKVDVHVVGTYCMFLRKSTSLSFSSLFCLPAVISPATENTRSAGADDAGAVKTSRAIAASADWFFL